MEIVTMDSSEVERLFKKELYDLYERYQLYVGSCCMVGISRLGSALAYDEEGDEVYGIEAVKLKYEE